MTVSVLLGSEMTKAGRVLVQVQSQHADGLIAALLSHQNLPVSPGKVTAGKALVAAAAEQS